MQNQTQTVTAVTGQIPGRSPDADIVRLERAFRQGQTSARPGALQHAASEKPYAFSNLAFLRRDLPLGALEVLAALCADLMEFYARAAKLSEAQGASYALCVEAHKMRALASDARDRLRRVNTSSHALHEKRRVLASVFDAIVDASEDREDAIGRHFRICLNDDALPVQIRVDLAVVFARIRVHLREANAMKRAFGES
jgi:hypothetical protein